jgi:hypothetical protein
MRFLSITILVLLVANGCATQSRDDVIDRVARALERSQVQGLSRHEYRTFPSQICACILLPSNAPPAQVAIEALKTDPAHLLRSLAEGHPFGYGSTRVLRVRKVRIQSPQYERAFPGSDPLFTAVLMDTSVGRVVVLLQYKVLDGTGSWEHWTIDPDRMLNQPDRANRRQPLGFREQGGERSIIDLRAAVAHLDC